MKTVDELVKYYGNRLGDGELEVDTTELYSNLSTLQGIVETVEYKYKDTIRMLIGMVETNNYNPNNYYEFDIVSNAKRLSSED